MVIRSAIIVVACAHLQRLGFYSERDRDTNHSFFFFFFSDCRMGLFFPLQHIARNLNRKKKGEKSSFVSTFGVSLSNCCFTASLISYANMAIGLRSKYVHNHIHSNWVLYR